MVLQTKFRYEYDTIFKTYNANFTQRYVGGIDVLTENNTTYVAYNYCGDNTIKLINLSNDSIIVISQYNTDCEQMNTRIVNNDIYTIKQDNKVYIYCEGDKKAELICDLMTIPTFKQSGLVVNWYKEGGDQHVNISKNNLYFRVNYNYDDSLGVFSKMDFGYPSIAKIDLETNNVSFFGPRPYFDKYQTYGLPSRCFDLYIGDSIITSNGINGEINIINTLSGEITEKEVKSGFDTIPIKKYHPPENDNRDKTHSLMQHFIESPFYESLFYNPKTRYYYRIFHPHMDERNKDGELNTQYDKQSVLMILNDEFELLDEVLLPPQKRLQMIKLYPADNGVIIDLPEFREVLPEKITFSYFKVSHFEK